MFGGTEGMRAQFQWKGVREAEVEPWPRLPIPVLKSDRF